MSILIVESGSTKTDWCYVSKGKKTIFFKTSGINPLLQSNDDILSLLQNQLKWNINKRKVANVYFYGAGVSDKKQQQRLEGLLTNYFGVKKAEVNTDILAAARGLCGKKKGVVSILGTGSNCCFYNGEKIINKQPSLGYIAGDEGSGNFLGKKVLQYYAYNTFDEMLKASFEAHFGNDLSKIVHRLYKEPFPNRLLASFVKVLVENRGHFMVENIIEDGLNDFFHVHLLKLRQSWKHPIHFTGSIAYVFNDIIKSLCSQYEFKLGTISQNPLNGLISYHS
jgi:N-acetylglucosamine kinase-like BadF-type ATPase